MCNVCNYKSNFRVFDLSVDHNGYRLEIAMNVHEVNDILLKHKHAYDVRQFSEQYIPILGKIANVYGTDEGCYATLVFASLQNKAETAGIISFLSHGCADVSILLDVSIERQRTIYSPWDLPDLVDFEATRCKCGGCLEEIDLLEFYGEEYGFEREQYRCRSCAAIYYKKSEPSGVLPGKSGDDCPVCNHTVSANEVPGIYMPGFLICSSCANYWQQ